MDFHFCKDNTVLFWLDIVVAVAEIAPIFYNKRAGIYLTCLFVRDSKRTVGRNLNFKEGILNTASLNLEQRRESFMSLRRDEIGLIAEGGNDGGEADFPSFVHLADRNIETRLVERVIVLHERDRTGNSVALRAAKSDLIVFGSQARRYLDDSLDDLRARPGERIENDERAERIGHERLDRRFRP